MEEVKPQLTPYLKLLTLRNRFLDAMILSNDPRASISVTNERLAALDKKYTEESPEQAEELDRELTEIMDKYKDMRKKENNN